MSENTYNILNLTLINFRLTECFTSKHSQVTISTTITGGVQVEVLLQHRERAGPAATSFYENKKQKQKGKKQSLD